MIRLGGDVEEFLTTKAGLLIRPALSMIDCRPGTSSKGGSMDRSMLHNFPFGRCTMRKDRKYRMPGDAHSCFTIKISNRSPQGGK